MGWWSTDRSRADPGNPTFSAANIPKVLGGWDESSGLLARDLYAAVVPQVVPVSSCEVAEAYKILENIYRADDPHVPALPSLRYHTIRLESTPPSAEALALQDCTLVVTG